MNHTMWKRMVTSIVVTLALASLSVSATESRPKSGSTSRPRDANCPPPYVASGQWTLDEFGPVLQITPTDCGRRVKGHEIDVFAIEVVKKFSGNSNWRHSQALIDQLECHIIKYPDKPTYNIEPDRPYIGLTRTMEADCNQHIADPDPPPKT